MALAHPRFVKGGVLHAFTAGDEVAVNRVQRAVAPWMMAG